MIPTNETGTAAISVGLYIRGVGLDPDVVTNFLAVQPTIADRAGDLRGDPAGKHTIVKQGLWAKVLDIDGGTAEDALDQLISSISNLGPGILSIPGVQEAHWDVFVARSIGEELRVNFTLFLNEELLRIAASVGLPLRFEFAAIPD